MRPAIQPFRLPNDSRAAWAKDYLRQQFNDEISSKFLDRYLDALDNLHLYFVQSDLNPDYGHLVVDVTSMDFDSEYDAILCISVLEHVDRFLGELENAPEQVS